MVRRPPRVTRTDTRLPYTTRFRSRGAEVSRAFAASVDEAKALVDAGAKEITLLGQNVNAWADGDGRGLDHLIRALDRIEGLARIRYTTSHPNDMTQGLIDAHAQVEQLMPFLHLPVQSGSSSTEASRVGKECVRTCRSRWWPYTSK